VGAGLGISLWLAPEGVERYAESLPIARAMLEESTEPWPPTREQTELATADVSTLDAGAPAEAIREPEPRSDGSPLLEPPESRPGFRVIEDRVDGIYYYEAVMGDAELNDALPIVVVLHGRNGRATLPGGPFLGLTHPMRVIVPQAPDRLRDGFQWIPVYVNQGLVDQLSSTLFRASGRVARLIHEIVRTRGTVGRPIVTGFSQGGMLALALALHHDDVVGWAFPLSGWLPPPLEPPYRRGDLRFPTIRAMHGASDRTVPIVPTHELFERLSDLAFDVTLEVFDDVDHTTTEPMNALFHEWLEEAVCQTVGDTVCAQLAVRRAAEILGEPLPDGGWDAALDAGDAALDAGDAGDAYVDGETERDSASSSPSEPPSEGRESGP
jgi:phospholipase/carboxylesterase